MKPFYLIQLCCYAEMLESMIGMRPETIGVVLGSGERIAYRTEDFFYYYRGIRQAFLDQMAAWSPEDKPLPEPKADHGRWASHATAYLEEVDHVVRVAGVTRSQMKKLEHAGITTLAGLAESTGRVAKLDPVLLERLREQARLQRASVGEPRPRYRVVEPHEDDPRRGLAALPAASPMDVFFDMEGDPLLEGGLEYLFGATYVVDGKAEFWDAWAFDESGEKQAFEGFVDWVLDRWRQDPSMHVYHYAPYERTALKRLMGKYATREEEVDHLLRNDVLVDLYRVVKEGVRIGTPSYSLKDVEKLYMERDGEVTSAGESIVEFERFLASEEARDWKSSPILTFHSGLQPGRLRLHLEARGVVARAAGRGRHRVRAPDRRACGGRAGTAPRGASKTGSCAAAHGRARERRRPRLGASGPRNGVSSPGAETRLVELLRAP